MRLDISITRESRNRNSAFTLVEVVMAITIIAAVFGGVIIAYTQSARRAQWSGYQLAAQAMAIQQIEQVRAARWELMGTKIDETCDIGLISSNRTPGINWVLTGYTWSNLDIPYSGTNYVRATNFVTISVRYLNQAANGTNVAVRVVNVNTVWPFTWGNTKKMFTNTICTLCSPDN
jgi:prepilin-type N-terminal cleavage/methylation domain-containing protein